MLNKMDGFDLKMQLGYDVITCITNRVKGYKNPKITKIYNDILGIKGLHHTIRRNVTDIFQVDLGEDHDLWHSKGRNQLNVLGILIHTFENLIQLMNYLGVENIEFYATNLLKRECLSRLLLVPDSLVEILNAAVEEIKNKMELK